MGYVIGSGGGDLVDGSGGDLGGGSLGKGEVIREVMKRDGGLVEAMGRLHAAHDVVGRLHQAPVLVWRRHGCGKHGRVWDLIPLYKSNNVQKFIERN